MIKRDNGDQEKINMDNDEEIDTKMTARRGQGRYKNRKKYKAGTSTRSRTGSRTEQRPGIVAGTRTRSRRETRTCSQRQELEHE
jgi:hypothetical protein